MSQGWQCPVCKTVWAPHVQKCTETHPQGTFKLYPQQPPMHPASPKPGYVGDPLPPAWGQPFLQSDSTDSPARS